MMMATADLSILHYDTASPCLSIYLSVTWKRSLIRVELMPSMFMASREQK